MTIFVAREKKRKLEDVVLSRIVCKPLWTPLRAISVMNSTSRSVWENFCFRDWLPPRNVSLWLWLFVIRRTRDHISLPGWSRDHCKKMFQTKASVDSDFDLQMDEIPLEPPTERLAPVRKCVIWLVLSHFCNISGNVTIVQCMSYKELL